MTTAVRTREAVLAELAETAEALACANAEATRLYGCRTALLQEGRQLVPPITQRELAATAKVTEEAIIQVLRKAALVDAHAAGEHTTKVPKCPTCKAEGRNGG